MSRERKVSGTDRTQQGLPEVLPSSATQVISAPVAPTAPTLPPVPDKPSALPHPPSLSELTALEPNPGALQAHGAPSAPELTALEPNPRGLQARGALSVPELTAPEPDPRLASGRPAADGRRLERGEASALSEITPQEADPRGKQPEAGALADPRRRPPSRPDAAAQPWPPRRPARPAEGGPSLPELTPEDTDPRHGAVGPSLPELTPEGADPRRAEAAPSLPELTPQTRDPRAARANPSLVEPPSDATRLEGDSHPELDHAPSRDRGEWRSAHPGAALLESHGELDPADDRPAAGWRSGAADSAPALPAGSASELTPPDDGPRARRSDPARRPSRSAGGGAGLGTGAKVAIALFALAFVALAGWGLLSPPAPLAEAPPPLAERPPATPRPAPKPAAPAPKPEVAAPPDEPAPAAAPPPTAHTVLLDATTNVIEPYSRALPDVPLEASHRYRLRLVRDDARLGVAYARLEEHDGWGVMRQLASHAVLAFGGARTLRLHCDPGPQFTDGQSFPLELTDLATKKVVKLAVEPAAHCWDLGAAKHLELGPALRQRLRVPTETRATLGPKVPLKVAWVTRSGAEPSVWRAGVAGPGETFVLSGDEAWVALLDPYRGDNSGRVELELVPEGVDRAGLVDPGNGGARFVPTAP